jgi:hypothetical protein
VNSPVAIIFLLSFALLFLFAYAAGFGFGMGQELAHGVFAR